MSILRWKRKGIDMDYKEKYEELLSEYRSLQRKYNDLQVKYDESLDKLYSAKFRIENELEPRIKSEKRAYDNWATNPQR